MHIACKIQLRDVIFRGCEYLRTSCMLMYECQFPKGSCRFKAVSVYVYADVQV